MPAGRPTLFTDRIAHIVKELSSEGKTLEQIADIVNINARTLYYWRHSHKEFFQSLEEAKDLADSLVEASVFQSAVGYVIEENRDIFNPITGETKTKKYKKQLPPNMHAAMFWLENRKPEKWGKRKASEETIIIDQNKPEILEHQEYMTTRLLEMKKAKEA